MTVEERLRDSFAAAAGRLPADRGSDVAGVIQRGRRRRRLRRVGWSATAVAAVAAVGAIGITAPASPPAIIDPIGTPTGAPPTTDPVAAEACASEEALAAAMAQNPVVVEAYPTTAGALADSGAQWAGLATDEPVTVCVYSADLVMAPRMAGGEEYRWSVVASLPDGSYAPLLAARDRPTDLPPHDPNATAAPPIESSTGDERLPSNQWAVLSEQSAQQLVPFTIRFPRAIPDGYEYNDSVAVMQLDADGDGSGDLYRVAITLTPTHGPRDANGHGNISISQVRAEQVPAHFRHLPTQQLERGVQAHIATEANTSAVIWVEDGVLTQISGELPAHELAQVAEGMT